MKLLLGDCLDRLRDLDDTSIDAVITDPPYGISFMGKHWDRFDIEERVGKRDVSQLWRLSGSKDPGEPRHMTRRTSSAFANGASAAGAYDFSLTGSHAFQAAVEEWATEWLRVLKPGGHAVVFGGTRTFHRLASGIEDAGFEIRDQLQWLFGQGFPKSLNLDGEYEGWGTALKPGYEPIILARKPLDGTVAANMATHGVGALHIAATGIPISDRAEYERNHSGDRGHAGTRGKSSDTATDLRPGGGDAAEERWPANVVLDMDAAALLDEQSGQLVSGANPTRRGSDKFRDVYGDFAGQEECAPKRGVDVGGASRFFYCAKVSAAERNAGCEPSLLTPEAPDRNDHPTVKPLALMRWLIRLVTPEGGVVLDPFLGSGSTACAAVLEGRDMVGIEREEAYMAIARARVAYWSASPVEEVA